jgi:hypothetical protein
MPIPIAAVLGFVAGQALGIEAFNDILNGVVWTLLPYKRYEPGDAVELEHRELLPEGKYTKIMKANGYDEKKSHILYHSSKRLLEIGDLIRLKWRKLISDEEFIRRAGHIRIKPHELDLILKAAQYFPSPQEVIRFAVREVFSDEIVDKFRLDEDIPETFLELADKVGLSEEVATWTWRAHWILPSLTSGYEMLHRRIITKDELHLLLRTQDVMPYWRDKLIELSYRPLTRVDIRRMYDLGELDSQAVYESYLDYGYSPKNAELMTRFTEKYAMPTERDLAKSEIKKLYKLGEFEPTEAMVLLDGIGYTEIAATFIVALWTHELESEMIDDTISVLESQLLSGIINVETFLDEVNKLEISALRTQRVVAAMRLRLQKRLKMPSKADLKEWLKEMTIDKDKYTSYMQAIGYRLEEIRYYYKSITGEEFS